MAGCLLVLLLQWYLKVYDASADFLLSSKWDTLGRDFPEGLASLEHAKEVAARRMKRSWDVTVALLHVVLASPLYRTRLLRHFSSKTMRNLSMTMSLAILAIVLILLAQFLCVRLQLERCDGYLEDTKWVGTVSLPPSCFWASFHL